MTHPIAIERTTELDRAKMTGFVFLGGLTCMRVAAEIQ